MLEHVTAKDELPNPRPRKKSRDDEYAAARQESDRAGPNKRHSELIPATAARSAGSMKQIRGLMSAGELPSAFAAGANSSWRTQADADDRSSLASQDDKSSHDKSMALALRPPP